MVRDNLQANTTFGSLRVPISARAYFSLSGAERRRRERDFNDGIRQEFGVASDKGSGFSQRARRRVEQLPQIAITRRFHPAGILSEARRFSLL